MQELVQNGDLKQIKMNRVDSRHSSFSKALQNESASFQGRNNARDLSREKRK